MNPQLFGIVWVWKARTAATTVEQAIAPLKPSPVGYQTVRRAGAAVNASQPAEYHARTQRDDPRRCRPIASPHSLAPWISLDSRRSFRR